VSHKIDKIYAFGSSVTERFDLEKSDIDLVVSLAVDDPLEYGELLLSLWDSLELFFGRKVDLLTDDSIRNPYLRTNIERTKKLVYDGQGEKIFV
jgi:hypothetical protein